MIRLTRQRINNFFAIDLRYLLLIKYSAPRLYNVLSAFRSRFFGMRIRLEASSVCNLRCVACSTSRGKNRKGVVGWGFLKFEDFKKLLDENPQIKSIELSNWGEIFLNPRIIDIMRCAFERGVQLKAANGVNLNRVNDEILEALVIYKFRYISVSIDGASQETYSQYRIKGNFDKVIKNIRKLNGYKQKHNSVFPRLAWQFVIFGHNEHELQRVRELAQELGMAFRPKLNHTPAFSPVKDADLVRQEGGYGAASREEYRNKNVREYSFPCGQLWDHVQINWDGKLLGCCVNKFGDFGNVFEEGLSSALSNEKMTYAKLMIMGKKPPRADIPCIKCKTFHRMLPEAMERFRRELEATTPN